MRVIFNEELKAVADDLDHMVKGVRKAINGAGDALLNQNLEAAQAVIDGDIEIDALEASVVDQCVKLLAKQNPVATDLRVVVSTMRLATTFERMGDLARHIAEAARRTYPASPLPAEAQPLFAEMQAFLNDVADQTVAMLSDRDTKTAEQIIINDDKLDELGQIYLLAGYAGRRDAVAWLNDYYRTLGATDEDLLHVDAPGEPTDSLLPIP